MNEFALFPAAQAIHLGLAGLDRCARSLFAKYYIYPHSATSGSVDSTACSDVASSEAFAFLFNPNMLHLTALLRMDESLALPRYSLSRAKISRTASRVFSRCVLGYSGNGPESRGRVLRGRHRTKGSEVISRTQFNAIRSAGQMRS
jgi:hypothetical protein